MLVLPGAGFSIQNQEAAVIPRFDRGLGDALFGEMIVEVGGLHEERLREMGKNANKRSLMIGKFILDEMAFLFY